MAGLLRIRRKPQLEALETTGPPPGDSYLTRLVKLIPGEAQSLYALGISAIKGDNTRPYVIGWIVICAIVVVVVRWIGTADKRKHEPPDFVHIGLSLLAFIIWIYATSDLLKDWPNTTVHGFLPALLVIVFMFVVPYVYKGEET